MDSGFSLSMRFACGPEAKLPLQSIPRAWCPLWSSAGARLGAVIFFPVFFSKLLRLLRMSQKSEKE